MMKISVVKDVEPVDTPHKVDVKKLYDTEHAQIMHIALKPGEKLKRHITPVDVAFYVLEGRGIVEIGEEKRDVCSDTLIESPANIVHCWYNESNELLRILVIKAPRPVKKTVLL